MQRFALATLFVASLGYSMVSGANAVRPLNFEVLTSSAPVGIAMLLAEDTGRFVTVDPSHPTSGRARIVTEGGQNYFLLDETFRTASGPDVQVVLHTSSEVPVNLTDGNYEAIALLESFEGAQRYLIPNSIDLSNYKSAAIWCREFNVTFGYAPL